ncbi:MAG: HigA family addiction module antitoxin [Prolixibacteraceae bacterium]
MLPELKKIKGIHPGYILKRELKSLGLKGSHLASSIGEHKQTISAILNRKRKITPILSIKLSKTFNVDQDYFMLLQASYEVNAIAKGSANKIHPNLDKFRHILFWDTDINTIDWDKQKRAIIKRILERGNDDEIIELISFYGKKTVSDEIKQINNPGLARFDQNIIHHRL